METIKSLFNTIASPIMGILGFDPNQSIFEQTGQLMTVGATLAAGAALGGITGMGPFMGALIGGAVGYMTGLFEQEAPAAPTPEAPALAQ